MSTPIVAMRLPKDLIRGLRREAHRESLKRDVEVSWVFMLKLAAQNFLDERGHQDNMAEFRIGA